MGVRAGSFPAANQQRRLLRESGDQLRSLISIAILLVAAPAALAIAAVATGRTASLVTAILYALAAAVLFARVLDRSRRVPSRNGRRALSYALGAAIAAAREGQPGALLYVDVDRFDAVRLTLGVAASDRLLGKVMTVIEHESRLTIYREQESGDEFLLVDSGRSAEDVGALAERLRVAVGNLRHAESAHVVDVRVSIGIAPIDGLRDAISVVEEAHAACASAKSRGGNRVESYRLGLTEQAERALDAAWTVRLKDALRDGSFEIWSQPIVNVASGAVDHYEVLLRLPNDDGTITAAAEFIPTAERCGLIRDIDRHVVPAALARAAADPASRWAINLSGLSVHESDTVDFIEQEMARSSVDPGRITFEITETAAMADLPQARLTVERLRRLGCHVALDDFGRGSSSLAYLRTLPVDVLKIDGAFVRGLVDDPVNNVIVRAINDLAHALSMRTVAECVEDPGALATLGEIGVDLAQGYHIGMPSRGPDEAAHVPAVRPAAHGRTIVLPARPPDELLSFVAFLDQLDTRMRALRDTTSMSRSTLTRPDEFDPVVLEVVSAIRVEAERALEAGDPLCVVRLPLTPELVALARWAELRMDVLSEVTRTGLVQPGWEAPLKVMFEIYEAVLAQIED